MGNKGWSWFLFIILSVIWGSSFVLMREAKHALLPAHIGGLRIFSAGLVLLPIALYGLRSFPTKKIPMALSVGFFGNLFPAYLFAVAITKLESGVLGILNALTPLCVVLIGALLYKHPISSQKLVGIFIGFAGMVLLSLTQHTITLDNYAYIALILIATLSYGFNVNFYGQYLQGQNAIIVSAISLAGMAIPAGALLWWSGFFRLPFTQPEVREAVTYIVILGVVGSAISTILFYKLVKIASPLFASMVTYGIPFIAILWSAYFGEEVTWLTVLCLLIILGGVFVVNYKKNVSKNAAEVFGTQSEALTKPKQ